MGTEPYKNDLEKSLRLPLWVKVGDSARMKGFLPLLALLCGGALLAQDQLPDLRVQNSGGTLMELHNVKLMRVEPDGLRVFHAGGIAKVPYERLPAELQEKYGISSDKAKEHRDAVTAAATEQAAAAAAAQEAAKQAAARQAAAALASYPAPTTRTYQPTQQTYASPNLLAADHIRTPRISRSRSSRFSRNYSYSSSCSPYGSCGGCSTYSVYGYGSYYPSLPVTVSSGSLSAGVR